LRAPETTLVQNVAFLRERESAPTTSHGRRMQERPDAPDGRGQYGQRFATVEPVFANIRYNKRFDRFTLRGRAKVEAHWQLFCLVHNIEKLVHAGYVA